MPKEDGFPYPTPYEALRYMARMLGLKQSNKFLDDKACTRIFEPREFRESLEKHLYHPIEKYMGSDANRIISNGLNSANEHYLELVSSYSADGISRAEMMPLLQSNFIRDFVVKIVGDIHDHFGGPQPAALFSSDTHSVKTALSWIEKHEAGWENFKHTLPKEQKDRISAWRRGDDLASSQGIYLLQRSSVGPWPEQINWQKIRVLLFVARSVDFLRRELKPSDFIDEVRVSLLGEESRSNLADEIRNLQVECSKKVSDAWPLIADIQNGLRIKDTKNNADTIRGCLDSFRARLAGTEEQVTTGYWIDWHEARWHVFSGDLERAQYFYEVAFEGSLFRSGSHQKEIIEEALVVASSVEKIDKVFLKHLKWMAINFGYDIPSVNTPSPSKKYSDSIEDWEVELWQSQIGSVFPDSGLFQGVSYKDRKAEKGPLIIMDSNQPQPDFRYPDRKVKIKGAGTKSMPQLVWYIQTQKFDVVAKLINKGANVNVVSSAGETPILMALQEINPTNLLTPPLDDRFFELISSQKHDSKIMNTRTQKRRLLPIICAVETGRPNVVEKVLEMGASPNGRGRTDEQTALNICLAMIATAQAPQKILRDQYAAPPTLELYDAMRRHSVGSTGFTLDHQKQAFMSSRTNSSFMAIESAVIELMAERYVQADAMREIAAILIEAGADVNAWHTTPIKGYTPLMLSAELDESELFELMLEKGGDAQKGYLHPNTNEKINCYHISRHFRSEKVLKSLNKL
ncbi:MAG: hypothetical protein JKX83_01040 [Pseudomonadales bacterium]|nr:hypothetical protein [Pseudomonadales bacterium]